ncbi:PIN-like domain-containing protein [Chitinophaga sp. sic0106]|uniref:PIN-like domain-containing protein n=1 Tax=Chitinophaga sp. sic0106 TaxID=2854785 RepID=UPI001C48B47C|nr:PIN-like domain-containing protein [Chitinophaga sp. sic0106]MBV7531006.1 DUF4935 domain-containing protein [Chitinophaga sp. sic0106]
MYKEFIGYYEPTKEELEQSWNEAVLVLDANTLLNLYRYSESTKKVFLSVLESQRNRLYIPYQVAYEFHKNRRSVIETTRRAYEELNSDINTYFNKHLIAQINRFERHPTINISRIKKYYEEFMDKVKADLSEQEKKHPDFSGNDELLMKITELFSERIGDAPSEEQLLQLYKRGEERYKKLIPPGYKDAETKKKDGERAMYGDWLIWSDLIAQSKKTKNMFILITDDLKEDWWRKESGKTVSCRPELIKEFYDETKTRLLLYSADQFLRLAKDRNLIQEISEDTIAEMETLRETDVVDLINAQVVTDNEGGSKKDNRNTVLNKIKLIKILLNIEYKNKGPFTDEEMAMLIEQAETGNLSEANLSALYHIMVRTYKNFSNKEINNMKKDFLPTT